MELERKIEKKRFWRKIVAAAALLVIFACVVFSMPPERLAWQAPFVMGSLLLPKPSPGPYVRPETLKENTDSSLSLLAFISVTGILALAIVKIPEFRQVRRISQLKQGLRLSIVDKITIMYIL